MEEAGDELVGAAGPALAGASTELVQEADAGSASENDTEGVETAAGEETE